MSQGNFLRMNRRNFLERGITSFLTLNIATSAMSSCTTFDEYLIEDQFDFDQDVIIIGCGLPALYAAYELKKNKIPFKLFGPDFRFGSELLTIDNAEWGYFKFEKNDVILMNLVKELNLEIKWLNSQQWVVKSGASAVINELVDLVQGIMPKKQLRLDHKLSQIHKFGSKYQLVFQTKEREKTFYAKKVIIALEPHQLKSIKDLNLVSGQTAQLVKDLDNFTELDYLRVIIDDSRFKQNKSRSFVIKNHLKDKSSKRNQDDASLLKHNLIEDVHKLSPEMFCLIDVTVLFEKYHLTFTSEAGHPIRQIQNLQNIMSQYFEGTFAHDEIYDWGAIVSQMGHSTEVNSELKKSSTEVIKPRVHQSFLQFVNSTMIRQQKVNSVLEQVLNLTHESLAVYKADI